MRLILGIFLLCAMFFIVGPTSAFADTKGDDLGTQYSIQWRSAQGMQNIKGCETDNGIYFCYQIAHMDTKCDERGPVDLSNVVEVEAFAGYYSYETWGYVKFKDGHVEQLTPQIHCVLLPNI